MSCIAIDSELFSDEAVFKLEYFSRSTSGQQVTIKYSSNIGANKLPVFKQNSVQVTSVE